MEKKENPPVLPRESSQALENCTFQSLRSDPARTAQPPERPIGNRRFLMAIVRFSPKRPSVVDVTIDDYGRIVIPKDVRDQLGIESGSALEIEVSPGEAGRSITLTQKGQKTCSSTGGRALGPLRNAYRRRPRCRPTSPLRAAESGPPTRGDRPIGFPRPSPTCFWLAESQPAGTTAPSFLC